MLGGLTSFCAEGGKPMAETSPTQLINDWQTAAKKKDANTLGSYYTDNAVLCATEGIISGKSNISGDFAEQFKNGFVLTEATPQAVNLGASNWAWAYGQWSGSAPQVGNLSGYWSILLVNQAASGPANWLIQQHSIVTG
jgi:ketosteroid isomerase-like protein